MRVKKVINNNIVCAVDSKGRELIVTGRGLGFKRQIGERIDESKIEKRYCMEEKSQQKKLCELVTQIPVEDLELTQSMIQEIKRQVSHPLNESLLITLADHISFAIKRKREGIEFSNPLAGSIMCYYPTEHRLGLLCLEMIQERYQISLHPDEASFIALHIVNAELNTNMSVMYDMTKFIDGCISVTEWFYDRVFQRDSLDFSRFVVHLRYFAQRLFQDQMMVASDVEQDILFRQMIQRNNKKHYACAQKIAEYVTNAWHRELSEEELIYLTIHLRRINR